MERNSAKEIIPTAQRCTTIAVPSGAGRGNPKEGNQEAAGVGGDKEFERAEDMSAAISISSISSAGPIVEDDRFDDESKHEKKKTRWKGHPAVEAQFEMLLQERMQKQQELERIAELSRVHKMAVVQRVAKQIQERCRAVPY